MEQAEQPTNRGPRKLKLAKVTDFGEHRLGKGLVLPGTFLIIESLNINTMFLATIPRKWNKDFLKFCRNVEKIGFESGPR